MVGVMSNNKMCLHKQITMFTKCLPEVVIPETRWVWQKPTRNWQQTELGVVTSCKYKQQQQQ